MAEDTQDQNLYQKRIPIITRSVKGNFRNFKTAVLILAYSIYFGLPWVPWHHLDAPSQAVLFDLPGRRFFIFGLEIFPQDIFWLALLLFIAAAVLFFATSLIGRAFCGYFCFQTLWTDAFVWIEHWIQGERPARTRLVKQPWNGEKILKVGGTHVLQLLLAFWTAFTFAAYYTYAPQFFVDFVSGNAATVGYATVLILTMTTYIAAAHAREQICTYVCPYARFQGVMYEPETLAPNYNTKRGEGAAGRISAKSGLKTLDERHANGHGDCIDCGFCVQVCPAGIDIRNGLQYQCISCGLCIDACNNIMDSMGYPRGLIRYDSEKNLGQEAPGKPHLEWYRLRTLGYGAAIILMVGYLFYTSFTRTTFEISVQQVRQPLFVTLSNGNIRNRYQVRVTNKSGANQDYRVEVKGLPAANVDMGGMDILHIDNGRSRMANVSVILPPDEAARAPTFEFEVIPVNNPKEVESVTAHFHSNTENR